MSARHRIHTIYWKELIDILRDRRTLIAMIVVPIVLYPLLMLGSVQAVTAQGESLSVEQLVLGTVGNQARGRLLRMIESDRVALERRKAEAEAQGEDVSELPEPLQVSKVKLFGSEEALAEAVATRQIYAGVVFSDNRLIGPQHYDAQVTVTVRADFEEIRSSFAAHRLEALIGRVNERMTQTRLAAERLPPQFFEPFVVEEVDLSSPPSILGQILPLILILMTITGAIYPAIDLTAGERERGTLETLMVCPVPVMDLVVGKFLVVTTVAIMGAALNLASVTATVYYGGFDQVIASSEGSLRIGTMLLILLALIPFAVLMYAIMIAVCSYARTFKEAQNYVTPVILAVLIPGGIAAFPATRLEGIMLVMPVGNMVALTKEMLLGGAVGGWDIAMVLFSTSLYAAAAIAIAAGIFGKESVVFSDAGSFGSMFSRRLLKRTNAATASMGLLTLALLFPLWFYVQTALSPREGESAISLLQNSAWLMGLLFVGLPVVLLVYRKVNVASALSLRIPSPRYMLGGVLVGLSAWVVTHELAVFQQMVVATPEAVVNSSVQMAEALKAMNPLVVIFLIALVPAICEETLFRGFLLGALRGSGRRFPAIIASACIFGVFHFFIFKFVLTASLGIVLAYLCWQSRSILPSVIAHFLHNGLQVSTIFAPEWQQWIGIPTAKEGAAEWAHLPFHVLIAGGVVFVIGIGICRTRSLRGLRTPIVASAEGA